MAKRLKRAFTITELVIVIAVVAILAAVLIPTFMNIIKKADESADTQLVKNLNTILSSEQTVSQEAAPTMSKALEQAQEGGYTVDKLTPTSDGDILWEQDSNRFVLVSGGEIVFKDSTTTASLETEPYKFWKITNEDGEIKNNAAGYSYYLGNKYSGGKTLDVTAGLDVGEQAIEKITYTTGEEQAVVFNTSGGTLEIDAPNSDVKHYGSAKMVDVKEVKGQSYHLYGTITDTLKVTAGHIYIEAPGAVNVLDGTAVTEESGKATATIDMSSSATVGTVVIAKDVAEAALGTALKGAVEGGAVDTVEEIPEEASLFAGGIGTEKSPFLIETAGQFLNISQMQSEMAYGNAVAFKLISDIDLSKVALPSTQIVGCFHGVLDGNGCKIISGDTTVWLSTEAIFGVTVKDLTIVQRGGTNNSKFKLFAYAGWDDAAEVAYPVNDRGTYIFEDITVQGLTNDTVISVDTNESTFLQQNQSQTKVYFINCVNEVNINAEAYAGIFLGGYAAYSKITYENCVNKAAVTGVTVGFFSGNTSGKSFLLASDKNFSNANDVNHAYAYVSNCRNDGTIVGTVSCGPFARGNTVLNAAFNQEANNALTENQYHAGTMVEGNVDDMSINVVQRENEQVLQISPSQTNEQIASYTVVLRVSVGYHKADGSSAGSSYFVITFPSVLAHEAESWYNSYVSKVVLSTTYDTAYDDIAAEEQTDDRSHTYKLVKQKDGSYWAIVNYESLLSELSSINVGEGGYASIGGLSGVAVPTYELTAKNEIDQTIGFQRFADGLTVG